jgi:hypothetical protein
MSLEGDVRRLKERYEKLKDSLDNHLRDAAFDPIKLLVSEFFEPLVERIESAETRLKSVDSRLESIEERLMLYFTTSKEIRDEVLGPVLDQLKHIKDIQDASLRV